MFFGTEQVIQGREGLPDQQSDGASMALLDYQRVDQQRGDAHPARASGAATPAQGRDLYTNTILAAQQPDGPLGSFADRVARSLGMDILGERFPSGEKLPAEAELLTRYGVSRTVLREAIKTLTAKGMLVSRTRVGTIVRDRQHWNFFDADVLAWKIDVGLDMGLLQSLREARLAVEPFAARLAAERSNEEQITEMRDSIQAMRAAVGDRRRFAEADLRFHRAVAAGSGNFLLSSFATVIETAIVCATLLLPLENGDLHEEAVARHEKLLQAIAKGRGERAAQLMSDMIGFGAAVGEQPSASRSSVAANELP